MKISEVIIILKAEKNLERTPTGRLITEYGVNTVIATLEDQKNWESDAVRCKNCCIILSSLLVPAGCPNCGAKDLTKKIEKLENKQEENK